MALGVDPPEKDIMDRKATKKKERILSGRKLILIFWQGMILTLGTLFIYFAGPVFFNTHDLIHDREIFQTCVFTTLVLTQLLHTYNFRFENSGIFRKNIFENKYLNLAVVVSILLQVGIIYIPWLQNIFKTVPLNAYQWLFVIAGSIIPVLIINFINEIIYRRRRIHSAGTVNNCN
jgi:Ca2+-transporting ATPase